MHHFRTINARVTRTATARRGAVMVYSLFIMMLMCGIVSLAVDYGRIQMIKSEEQRSADSIARGTLKHYLLVGDLTSTGQKNAANWATANLVTPDATTHISPNPIDGGSGVTPSVTYSWGYWNAASSKFKSGSNVNFPTALQVTVARTTQTGNPVALIFPLPSNKSVVTKTCDVWAQAIAILPQPVNLTQTVLGTWDPWLSGMSSGVASYDDSAPTNSPKALNVIPGSTISVTAPATGQISIANSNHYEPPDGLETNLYNHMIDSPDGDRNGNQNGISQIYHIPRSAMIGVFLDDNPPNPNATPPTRDYTAASRDQGTYNDLQNQQPFFIGDGVDSSQVPQNFVVPNNATRLFLGAMDGYEWKQDLGSFNVTFTEQPPIQLVQ